MRTAGPGGGRDARRSAAEFERARRHSRLVSVLKVGLPLAGLLIVGGGGAATWLARSLPDDVTVQSVGLEDGRLVMQDPRMSGTDGRDRPYSMIARRAIQSLGGGGIDLEGVRANVGVGADTTADIVAAKGLYDPAAETLRLFGGIDVTTSDGMTMALDGADIDLARGTMTGAGPVGIRTPSQTIEAGRLDVADGGKSLSFGGRVKMTLMPSAGAGTADPTTGGGPVDQSLERTP